MKNELNLEELRTDYERDGYVIIRGLFTPEEFAELSGNLDRYVKEVVPTLPKDHLLVMNMCGRGDKDIFTVAKHLGFDMKI